MLLPNTFCVKLFTKFLPSFFPYGFFTIFLLIYLLTHPYQRLSYDLSLQKLFLIAFLQRTYLSTSQNFFFRLFYQSFTYLLFDLLDNFLISLRNTFFNSFPLTYLLTLLLKFFSQVNLLNFSLNIYLPTPIDSRFPNYLLNTLLDSFLPIYLSTNFFSCFCSNFCIHLLFFFN